MGAGDKSRITSPESRFTILWREQKMSTKKKSIIGLVMFIAVMSIAVIGAEMLRAGQLTPSAPPGPTMKTLDEIPASWSQKIPDGAKRFEVVLDGAGVLDKETGLVWLRSPDSVKRTWYEALYYCRCLTAGGRRGWRLPTREELSSLEDMDVPTSPRLPAGHPFQNLPSGVFWSFTDYDCAEGYADAGGMGLGCPGPTWKTNAEVYVWPVRGGSNHGRIAVP
jgi:hypothetical protein